MDKEVNVKFNGGREGRRGSSVAVHVSLAGY
jgi:ribosome-associated protein YbcJ (S4-like RNA binding protein)